MRIPHLRFREFMLIITLISLITAAIAIGQRSANQLYVQDHLSLAVRARNIAKSMADRIPEAMRQANMRPSISEQWAAGCSLLVLPSVDHPNELPTEGRNLIVVTDVRGTPWFRLFDADGKMIADGPHWLNKQTEKFKKTLDRLRSPHELTYAEEDWLILSAVAFTNEQTTRFRKYVSSLETRRDEAAAEAESHERLATQR